MPRTSTLSSDIFRRAMLASAGFIAVALALVWAVCGAVLWSIDRTEWAAIDALTEEVEALYAREGRAGLLAALDIDGSPVWDDDAIYARLEEGAPLFALRDDETLLGGFEGLWAVEDDDDALIDLDHPEIDEPLRARAVEIDGDLWAVIGRFVPERSHDWDWLRWIMTRALLLIGLPLSVIIGYGLSRGVLRRIEAISDTADAIRAGARDSRIPLRGSGDEVDRLASKINQMLDDLAQLNRNIEAVSVGVAHDLKTPLSNLGGRLELLRRDLGDRTAAEAHVTAAEGYLDSVLRIFDALLRLGEVESGRRRAGFATVDLSALVADMTDSYAPLFEEAHKHLASTVAPGLRLQGDAALVQQLLSNLLENALEHARDAARVTVTLEATQGALVLRVGDDGPGIPPGDRARLFDRFYRGDASRTTRGNGLGLSLVKAIATLHDARVTLRDDTQGAVFEIEFPRDTKDYETV